MSGREDLVGQKVEMLTGQGSLYGEGKVISYTDVPSVTVEYPDGTRQSWRADMVRPIPPVELPTEGQHLGWLTEQFSVNQRVDRTLLVFNFERAASVEDASFGSVPRTSVLAWVPAVAVPKAALDELRAVVEKDRTDITFDVANYARAVLMNFLTAVDEANGDDR